MIVEHSFVTTREAPDALRTVQAFLRSIGIAPDRTTANSLSFRHGRERPHVGRSMWEWPLTGEVEYDRGRLSLAVGLTAPAKVPDAASALLTAIATGIEQATAGSTADIARAPFDDAIRAVEEEFNRRLRRRRIVIGGILLFFVAFIALIVVLVASH